METHGFGRAGGRFGVEHSGLMRRGATAQLYHRGELHTEADVQSQRESQLGSPRERGVREQRRPSPLESRPERVEKRTRRPREAEEGAGMTDDQGSRGGLLIPEGWSELEITGENNGLDREMRCTSAGRRELSREGKTEEV